jgi:hypothetical protein
MLQLNVGCIDGSEMIRMNNLAVGYFPSDTPAIGVYPPPEPQPQSNPVPLQPPEQVPVQALAQSSEMNYGVFPCGGPHAA